MQKFIMHVEWKAYHITQQTFVFQDVFSVTLFIFQDLLKTSWRRVCKRSCNYVFKTSWKTKKCYTEDVLKTSSVRLHQDECLLNVCIFFAHAPLNLKLQLSDKSCLSRIAPITYNAVLHSNTFKTFSCLTECLKNSIYLWF